MDDFDTLFARYQPELLTFSATLLEDEAAAGEITRDAFALLRERHALLGDAAAVRAFLYLTVRNGCLRLRQAQPAITVAAG